MTLYEIEEKIIEHTNNLDIIKKKMIEVGGVYDVLRMEKKKIKRDTLDLKQEKDRIIFESNLTSNYKDGDEIYISPEYNSVGTITHLAIPIDANTCIKIIKMNKKTVRFSYTHLKSEHLKTIAYISFGKFLKKYTNHGVKLKRIVKLSDVLNK